jgi:hypothetical protein
MPAGRQAGAQDRTAAVFSWPVPKRNRHCFKLSHWHWSHYMIASPDSPHGLEHSSTAAYHVRYQVLGMGVFDFDNDLQGGGHTRSGV